MTPKTLFFACPSPDPRLKCGHCPGGKPPADPGASGTNQIKKP